MGFDRLSRVYRPLEWLVFGRALQRARLEHLDECLAARSILLLGDGDGRFLKALLAAGCQAEIVSVDASPKMLALAQRRLGRAAAGVRFVCSPVETFAPADGFRPELVVAQFFFDCFTDAELGRIAVQVATWIKPGGNLLIADFAMPECGRLRKLWARLLLWKMLIFFRLLAGISARRLPDFGVAVGAAGFVWQGRRQYRRGLVIFSEVWRFGVPERS